MTGDATTLFETERPKLFALAYRMMGERGLAEDIVQDAWLRWSKSDVATIESPTAWLRQVTTRLAIDALRSARARREVYVGPWLPEPLVRGEAQSGEATLMLAEECELALLWAMERLSPEERAAFILREVFETDYADLARLLGKTETACRKLVSRASGRVKSAGPRFEATNEEVSDLLQRFMAATQAGDKETLMSLLAPDATAISDGGGKARAAYRPLEGPEDIASVILAVAGKIGAEETPVSLLVNGRPGMGILEGGPSDMVLSLSINEKGQITWIYMMRNPDKLGHALGHDQALSAH